MLRLIMLILFVIAVAHSPWLALQAAGYVLLGAAIGLVTGVAFILWSNR